MTRLLTLYAVALCAVLLVCGVWGLFDARVFGVLPTNRWHAVVLNLLPAAAGSWLIARGRSRTAAGVVGGGALLMGLLGLVTPAGRLLNAAFAHETVSYVSEIVAGAVALVLLALTPRSR